MFSKAENLSIHQGSPSPAGIEWPGRLNAMSGWQGKVKRRTTNPGAAIGSRCRKFKNEIGEKFLHIRLVECMTRKEVDNLQTDDSVASVMLSSNPGSRSFFPFFFFFTGLETSSADVRGERGEVGSGGRRGRQVDRCRLPSCVCAFRVPSYRPFLPHSEPSRHHSRPARPAAAFRSRAKEIEPLT